MNPIQSGEILAYVWADGSYVINDDEIDSHSDISMAKGYQASDDYLIVTGRTTLSQLSNQMGKHSIDLLSELTDWF